MSEESAPATSVTAQMGGSIFFCARLLSKAVTTICDDKLRAFGISSTQFALLAAISEMEPVTRAEIARLQHLNRSTLTRDLKAVLSAGWIEEVRENADGRSRPIALTMAGRELLLNAQPAWLAAQSEIQAVLGKDGMNAVTRCTDRISARANVDYYLALLENASVAADKRPGIAKLLIAEEDRLSHDLEQLEFAESRAASGRVRLNDLRRRLDGIERSSVHRPTVERLVANFEATQRLLDDFCGCLRAKVNSRL